MRPFREFRPFPEPCCDAAQFGLRRQAKRYVTSLSGLGCWIMPALAAVALLNPPTVQAQVTPQQSERIGAAVPDKPRIIPKKPRRVLVWNTPFMENSPHKGYCIPQGELAMKLLGEKTGAFTPVVSDDVAVFLPGSLDGFDAIIINNANGPWIRPTPEDMNKFGDYGKDPAEVESLLRQSLLDWLKKGAGIVAYHHAVGGNTHWPEFIELLGAGYDGHPWNEEVGIKVEEPGHPLVAAFGGEDFRIADEIYQFKTPYSRGKVRVLLSLNTNATNMEVKWINRKDGDFAIAWVREYGQGRIFYSALGHRTEIWWNPAILQFYLDGIQFATGDLEAPAKPPNNPQ